jgi:hypothetical protein
VRAKAELLAAFLICFNLNVLGQVYFDSIYNSGVFNITSEGIWGSVVKNDLGYVFLSFARDQGLYESRTWLVQTDYFGQQVQNSLNGVGIQIFMPADLIINENGYIGLSSYFETAIGNELSQYSMHKFDSNLSTSWIKYFGDSVRNDYAQQLIQCHDGSFLLVGQSSNSAITTADMYIVRTDSIGNQLWEKYYGGNSWEAALSAVQTPDSGFLLLGWTRSYGAGQRDFYLVKTDSVGNQEWQKTYGDAGFDSGSCIIALNDGNYLLAGYRNLNETRQGYLYKIDPTGAVIWENGYGDTTTTEEFKKVLELPDGSIVAAGLYDPYGASTSQSNNGGLLVKTDSEGNELWRRVYQKNNNTDLFYSVLLANDGGFLLSGQARNAETNSQDAWLLKVDSVGCPYPDCLVGIDEAEPSKVVVDVWPNPAGEYVRLQVTGNRSPQEASVWVTDMQGHTIQPEYEIASEYLAMTGLNGQYLEIDVRNWSDGLYIFTISNGTERARVRVVVQH